MPVGEEENLVKWVWTVEHALEREAVRAWPAGHAIGAHKRVWHTLAVSSVPLLRAIGFGGSRARKKASAKRNCLGPSR
jgi:hypothetical protein